GLQAGLAQPALVNAAKRHPIRTMHDHPTHGSLPFPLSSPIEIDIALMSLIPHRRGRTRRQWARVDLDHAMGDAHAVSDELLGEGRRRATIRQSVLVAVPRAGHTAVDDASLADRPILVGAKIGERPDLRAVAEDRNAFAVRRSDNARPLVRNRQRWPDCEPAFAPWAPARSPARSRQP